MSPSAELPELDPFVEDFQQFPFATLALLRERAPVHAMAEPGWYIVTTIELAREVLTDPARFSNQVSRRTPPPAEVADEVAAIRSRGFPYVPTLLLNDPPAHTRYRRMVQKALTPRALAWMDPLIADVAEELASALPNGRTIGLIERFARPLPVWAISRVLGLPDDRRDDVRRWTDAQLAPERWAQVERDLLDYQLTIAAELERRQQEPRDDLLSMLVAAAADPGPGEEPLGIAELVSLTRELMVAGNESTLRLLADIILQLDSRPEEWDRVRADEARDTTLGGVPLAAGSTLVVSLLSANRDESAFSDGDRFDPDRPPAQRHIAFGQGIHACIGNILARMEARHAVRALAGHVNRIDVIRDEPLRYLPSLIVRGLVELPVQVRRRPQPGL